MPLGDVSSEQLTNAYKKEIDSNVKERILLVRRVRINDQEASKVAERELHKSRWWAYKWLDRFDKHGLEGLKDHPRSGRPPLISQKKMLKIKQEISENPSGWQVKQVMDIIYKKTGIRYHEVHIYRLLHKWGFSPRFHRKDLLILHQKKRKRHSKRGTRNTLANPKRIHNSSTEDESIFVHDTLVKRKLWLLKGIRPVITVTGSHQRERVFLVHLP